LMGCMNLTCHHVMTHLHSSPQAACHRQVIVRQTAQPSDARGKLSFCRVHLLLLDGRALAALMRSSKPWVI
jgi:hypothetical protein